MWAAVESDTRLPSQRSNTRRVTLCEDDRQLGANQLYMFAAIVIDRVLGSIAR